MIVYNLVIPVGGGAAKFPSRYRGGLMRIRLAQPNKIFAGAQKNLARELRAGGSQSEHGDVIWAPRDASKREGRKAKYTGRLEHNPLFVEGAPYDEFILNARNVDFASEQFGLSKDLVSLIKSKATKGAKFSVVYHSGSEGIVVDAVRVVAPNGKGSVFTVYKLLNPDFEPQGVYRNELISDLPGGGKFGSVISSKLVAVPETAPESLRNLLTSQNYRLKEAKTFGSLGYSKELARFIGLADDFRLDMYELPKGSFADRFKVFYSLFKEDPEYRVLKIADTLGDVGGALLLGVITPKLWEQGTAYGIASTISSISNVGSPLVGIVGEGFLGSVVDHAVNSDKPMDNLKKVNLATAGLSTVTAGCYFALHPDILKYIPVNPAYAFIGLYATSTLSSGISGVMSGKANFAIHDQIINKGKHSKPEYARNFFQIMGVESSLSRAVYLGSYTATVAAAGALPAYSVALAGAGAALWAGSNFLFSLYKEKPEMKVEIEGSAFVHDGNVYRFDSGWEIAFRDGKGSIVKEDEDHFSVSFDAGSLYIKNSEPVSVTHKRRLKDYLPKVLAPKILGEKEHWELNDGKEKITVSRYGNKHYDLKPLAEGEYELVEDTGASDERLGQEA